MNFLKRVYFKVVPLSLIKWKSEIKERIIWYLKGSKIRKDILTYYNDLPADEIPRDYLEPISFLKKNSIRIICYSFPDKYNPSLVKVFTDQLTNLKYVVHDNNKLYFKRSWTSNKIKDYYNYLLIEQDAQSPHRYLSNEFTVNTNSTVVDAGAAEGIFSLNIINKASKIFLFEPDEEWIEALQETFKYWNDKVEILPFMLGDKVNENMTTIDSYFANFPCIDFIKIDVEGYEAKVLSGLNQLNNKIFRIAVCTYHKQTDESILKKALLTMNYKVDFTDGYLVFYYDSQIEAPYFRRGLIRATKVIAT